ncbi:pyridoxamine 5'-phosphate oxidase family protein [Cohnella sp. WQ 127256]|uniref:pyridoxamine 5'-phosphate oxidase family protein n=1 Tax=Cohnella sp. WQ 127256 TaxID=2938790 RepID=UPI002117514E|nr:pyridoxamine 5'-phosphate oxidase family protein [Cohnella sp. WQ 127256]
MAKSKSISTELSPEQLLLLGTNPLILLSTVDHESGSPSISAISWVKAIDTKSVRFAITSNSRILTNVKAANKVTLCFIGGGTVHTVTGSTQVLTEKSDGVAMTLSIVEISIDAVFDSMFWGAQITQAPAYEKTYDADKAQALDDQVYKAMLG